MEEQLADGGEDGRSGWEAGDEVRDGGFELGEARVSLGQLVAQTGDECRLGIGKAQDAVRALPADEPAPRSGGQRIPGGGEGERREGAAQP